jgi:hypothetical protein
MSDLDADLYGGKVLSPSQRYQSLTRRLDLYGNDEGENEQPQEETETNQPAHDMPSETPTVKAETPEETKPTPTTIEKSFSSTTSAQVTSTNGTAAIPTYTQPAPQQIPTYEQPLPNEYRDVAPPRADGGYSNIPINERSVRPSEMKDEG